MRMSRILKCLSMFQIFLSQLAHKMSAMGMPCVPGETIRSAFVSHLWPSYKGCSHDCTVSYLFLNVFIISTVDL